MTVIVVAKNTNTLSLLYRSELEVKEHCTQANTVLHPTEQGRSQSQRTSADPQSIVRHFIHCIMTINKDYVVF